MKNKEVSYFINFTNNFNEKETMSMKYKDSELFSLLLHLESNYINRFEIVIIKDYKYTFIIEYTENIEKRNKIQTTILNHIFSIDHYKCILEKYFESGYKNKYLLIDQPGFNEWMKEYKPYIYFMDNIKTIEIIKNEEDFNG